LSDKKIIEIFKLNQRSEVSRAAASLCHQLIGKKWSPEYSLGQTESWFLDWLNDDIPLAFVTLEENTLVGMCSLQFNDGIRSDLMPWLGDLCVARTHQGRGIGKYALTPVQAPVHHFCSQL